MTSQLISLLIIIAVLVIDFIINGRKKNVDDTQKRIEGYEGLKKFNLSEYLLIRKKNVVIFILFVFLSKPILHVSFFTEIKEIPNYEIKVIADGSSKDYYFRNPNGHLIHQKDTITFRWDGYQFTHKNIYWQLNESFNFTIYTSVGEQYLSQGVDVFYYPLETMPLSFNEHLEVMFKSKLWIFLVSIGALTVIVFLFNDKIKAR